MAKNKKKKKEVEKQYGNGIAPISLNNNFNLNAPTVKSNKKTEKKEDKKTKKSNKKEDKVKETIKVSELVKSIDPGTAIAQKYNTEEYNQYYNSLSNKQKAKENEKVAKEISKQKNKELNTSRTQANKEIAPVLLGSLDEQMKKQQQMLTNPTIESRSLENYAPSSETNPYSKNYNKTKKEKAASEAIKKYGIEEKENQVLLADYLKNYYEQDNQNPSIAEKILSPVTQAGTLVTGIAKPLGYQQYKREDGLKTYLPDKLDLNYQKTGEKIENGVGKFLYEAGGEASKILASSGINAIAPGAGTGMYWASMTGNNITQARNKATEKGEEATGKVLLNAAAKTGLEYVTGKFLGSATKGLTGGKASELEKAITDKVYDAKFLQSLSDSTKLKIAKLVGTGVSEGTEETIQDPIEKLIDILTFGDDGKHKNVKELVTDLETYKDALKAGAAGALTAGMVEGANMVTNSSYYDQGAAEIEKNKRTKNEQKIIDAELKNRIVTEFNGEATAKEIAQLQKEIIEDMEKGYVSTETIEQTLGGKTYKELTKINQKKNSIQQEIDELQKKADNNELSSLEEKQKLNDLKEEIKTIDDTEIRKQLNQEIQETIKNDISLQESYKEINRRSENFNVDLSKVEDEKQRAVYQKAMDSGVLNNSNKTHALVDMIAKISSEKGINFDFTNNEQLEKSGFGVNGRNINGYVTDSGITINLNSAKAINRIVGHELTHTFEGTTLYTELQDSLKDFLGSEWDNQVAKYKELYKGVKNANIENELTSDLIGDYLFTDENYVKNLSTKNKNLFEKVYDEIKYLYNVATAGSKEKRQLEKVKRTFDRIYNETESKVTTENAKYSISEDSQGRKLTKNQQEYFKDSKVRDENGNLMPVYHASRGHQFTVFDKNKGYNIDAFYFTKDSNVASHWSKNGKYVVSDESYNSIKNQINNAKNYQELIDIVNSNNFGYKLSIENGRIEQVYDGGAETSSPMVSFDKLKQDVEYNLMSQKYSGDIYKEYLNITNPLVVDAKNQPYHSVEFEGRKLNTETIASIAKERGYDGVIVKNVYETDYENRLTDDYIAFEPNQIKNVSNENPTSNEDIRFDISVKDAKTTKDNEGRKLSKDQLSYFKDSKAVDNDGNLITVYHTMTNQGTQFNEFNPVGTPYYRFGDQVVNYYTDDKNMSGSYADQDYVMADTSKITDKKGVNDILVETNNKLNGDRLFVIETNANGTYFLYDKLHKNNHLMTKLYKSQEELFKNIKQDLQERAGFREKTQYEGYINITNPYIVDADGEYWNSVRYDYDNEKVNSYKNLSQEIKDKLIKLQQDSIDKFRNSQYEEEQLRETMKYHLTQRQEHLLDLFNTYIELDEEQRSGIAKLYGFEEDLETLKKEFESPTNYLHDYGGMTLKEFSKDYNRVMSHRNDYSSNTSYFYSEAPKILEGTGVPSNLDTWHLTWENFSEDAILENFESKKTTNDVVKEVIEMNKNGSNYDGVVIKNVVDYGGRAEHHAPHNIYITFKSNQFKAADNTTPTEDADIRYSLEKTNQIKENSEDEELSEGQKEYFKNSKAVTNDGRLWLVHHGTKADFNTFDITKAGENGVALGNGFYFTNNKGTAYAFTKDGMYGTNDNQLKSGYVNIEKPASRTEKTMTYNEFKDLYKALNENPNMYDEEMGMSEIDALLSDYGDIDNDKENTIKKFYDSYNDDVSLIDNLSYMYSQAEMYKTLRDVTGYDGIIIDNPSGYDAYEKYFVTFNPDQFKLATNENPTTNPDIRYSLSQDSQGRELSEGQQEYFKDSKVRDENGNLIPLYHGTRSDFTIFDINKSGASSKQAKVGFWFTENKQGAENFGNSVWYGNSEKAKAMEVYLDIKNPKIYDAVDNTAEINKLDNDIKENKTKLDKIKDKYRISSFYTSYDGEMFLRYASIYGSKYSNYTDAEIINMIKNDYNLDKEIRNNPEEYLNEIKQYDKYKKNEDKYYRDKDNLKYTDSYEQFRSDIYAIAGMDAHDANIGGTGMAIDNENEVMSKYVAQLKEQGYDGIIIRNTNYDTDTLGKGNNQYVAFYSNQIKNIDNLNPTENDDIRYSLTRDSQDRELSEGQQEYFRDSKVRDENGNLETVYHQTKNDFTEFKNGFSVRGFKNANFFTNQKPKQILKNLMEGYVKIDNPLYLENTSIQQNIVDDAIANGYDGIINQNVQGIKGKNEIVTFSSNQFKNIDNLNPTDNPDIRYSLDIAPISKNFLTETEQDELDGLRAVENSGFADLTPEESRRMLELENRANTVLNKKAEKMLRSASYKAINTTTKIAENYLDFDAKQKKEFRSQMREFSNMTKDELVNADTYNKVKDIVNQYANKEYTYFDDSVESVKKELKHTKIKISDELKNQITDYGDFVRDSRLLLRRNSGEAVDKVYKEYSEMYPGFFDENVWNEEEQLEALNDFVNHDFSVTEKYRLSDNDLKAATDLIYNKLLDNSLTQQDLIETEEILDKKVQKRTRAIVDAELLNKMGITADTIQAGNDIAAIAFARTDPIRVNEKVFGWKTGQLINDATVNFTKHQEAERIRFLNKERQEIKDLGIKARSKESELVQKYGEKQYVDKNNEVHEYGDAELARDVQDVATREKIKHAARVLRQKYDTYLDMLNESITAMGYDEIPKRKDYMRHFVELDDVFSRLGTPFNKEAMSAEDLPTDINGLTEFNKPGRSYFANAKARTGLQTTYDAITGIDGYLEGMSNWIYHTESIQRYRALSRFIRENYGREHGLDNIDLMTDEELAERVKDIQDNKLSKYVAWLDEQANAIAGKKATIDRSLEKTFGRKVYTALNTLKSQIGSNMTGFNVRSAMTNFASLIQGMSKTQKIGSAEGLVSTVRNIVHDDGLMEKSDFLTSRLLQSDSLAMKPWQKLSKAGQVFMEGTDWFTANAIWRGKYYENLHKGMSEQQAIRNADDFAARIMGDRSKGSTAELFNSKTWGFLTQFQLEVNNQWSSLIHDNKIDIQKGDKTALGVTFELGQLFAASYMFNSMMKSLTGSDVMIDPVEMLMKIFNPDDDDKDKSIVERAQEVLGDFINQLPFASMFTGGRIPIGEAFKGGTTLVKKLSGGTDNYGNKIDWADVDEDLKDSLAYWILPSGWGQIKKTTKGLSMYDDKLPIAGSYTKSGNLRFSAEDTALGKVKAGLFGQYSSKYAQDYINSGYKPINASKLDEMKDLDMDSTEYREYRQGLSDAGTSIQDKLDYISSLDVSDEDKTIMASNAAKKDIDMSEYKKYGTYEEFNYAQKNPAKYQVMKYVGGYDTYKNYEKTINDITADYDRNGKAITNSRKNKVIKYVNSLNLTRAQKAMLIKEQYPSFTKYDNEIASYVNKQNIRYIEKASILKQLGFTAYDKQIINYIRQNYRTVEEQQEELEKLGFKVYNYNGKTYVR